MFKWLKRTGSLWVIGLIAYSVFLFVQLPAKTLWGWVKPAVKLPVNIENVQGLWWKGSAHWYLHSAGLAGGVKWNLNFTSLLGGKLGAQLQLQSTHFKAETLVKISPSKQLYLDDATFNVNAQLINGQLQSMGASLSGDLELRSTNAVIALEPFSINKLEGEAVWLGGEAQYPAGNQRRKAEIPILVGKLGCDSKSGNVQMPVTTTDGESVADVYLKKDGWGGVAIKRRLVDIIGEQWPSRAAPDDSIFTAEEKLF